MIGFPLVGRVLQVVNRNSLDEEEDACKIKTLSLNIVVASFALFHVRTACITPICHLAILSQCALHQYINSSTLVFIDCILNLCLAESALFLFMLKST